MRLFWQVVLRLGCDYFGGCLKAGMTLVAYLKLEWDYLGGSFKAGMRLFPPISLWGSNFYCGYPTPPSFMPPLFWAHSYKAQSYKALAYKAPSYKHNLTKFSLTKLSPTKLSLRKLNLTKLSLTKLSLTKLCLINLGEKTCETSKRNMCAQRSILYQSVLKLFHLWWTCYSRADFLSFSITHRSSLRHVGIDGECSQSQPWSHLFVGF